MIVKIQNRGHSFKGLASYLLNPKRDDPESVERVAWSETGNMYTNDIETAAKVMAWTDEHADELKANAGVKNTGAKRTLGGVYHYSLAWAHDEKPDHEHQRQAALETIKKHGLEDHEFFMVAHDDTEHAHVHIVVNLTNSEDGTRHKLGLNKRSMSDWAYEYEQEHGVKCQLRVSNRIEAQQLGHNIKHQDQRQDYAPEITKAYEQSDNGQAFLAALNDQGYTLARGRNGSRLMLVNGNGDMTPVARQIDGVNTKQIRAKLSDVDLKSLVDADELRRELLERIRREKEQEETERELKNERDLKNDELHKTTGEHAQDFIDLAHDPLQDMRGWLDEIGQGNGQPNDRSNVLPIGSAGSPALVGELQQVRKPRTGDPTEDRPQGISSATHGDSGKSSQGKNATDRIETGDIVKALDRDNIGKVQSVDGDKVRVLFTNKATNKQMEKVFNAEGLKLHRKALTEAEEAQRNIKNAEYKAELQRVADAKAEERARRHAIADRIIQEKTEASRQEFKIDKFQKEAANAKKAADLARAKFEENNTAFKRIVMFYKVRSLRDDMNSKQNAAEAAQATLEERMWRFEKAIEHHNKNRPEHILKRELDKHIRGIEDAGGGDSDNVKPSNDNKVLQEAQSSPEAAERLVDQVQAKTPKQAAKVAEVRQIAENRKTEKEAEKKQEKPHITAKEYLEMQRAKQQPPSPETAKPDFEQATTQPEEKTQDAEERLQYLADRMRDAQEDLEEQERLRREQERGGYDYDR